ncbi:Alpha-soluble NSF attachment protein, partial [Dirofilaria immitis]
QAIDCLVKTAETYTDMGRFNMAAKYHCTMAEIFESEAPDVTQAMAHYQEAADFYKGEESRSSATKCMIKVAQYAAQLEDYKRAIKIFEEVATWEADHPTLKYAAKNHFFQALLCYLCSDLLDTQNALKRYEEISPSFVDSREYKLVNELISCLEDKNQMMMILHYATRIGDENLISKALTLARTYWPEWKVSITFASIMICSEKLEEANCLLQKANIRWINVLQTYKLLCILHLDEAYNFHFNYLSLFSKALGYNRYDKTCTRLAFDCLKNCTRKDPNQTYLVNREQHEKKRWQ